MPWWPFSRRGDDLRHLPGFAGAIGEISDLAAQSSALHHSKGRANLRSHRWALAFGIVVALGAIALAVWGIYFSLLTPPATCTSDSDCPQAGSRCMLAAGSKESVCSAPYACHAASDCSGSSACVNGRCQPKTCSTTSDCRQKGGAGGQHVYCAAGGVCKVGCDESSDCSGGNVCVGHVCTRGGCSSDVDCATLQRCSAFPRVCQSYKNCVDASVCVNHTCRAACSASQPCADPLTQRCLDGACVSIPCTAGASLPARVACSHAGVVVRDPPAPPATPCAAIACGSDAECAAPAVCSATKFVCVNSAGQPVDKSGAVVTKLS